MALEGQQLLEYAYEQFEKRAYDAALEAFILAYVKGYEQEWALENIYNCYMAGNEAEFQKTYGLWGMDGKPKYEELILDFIPYREGEYYIFDKELRNFRGIFSVGSIGSFERQEDFRQMEFSALAVSMYWDWRRLPEILAEAVFHEIYAVCKDMNRCAAFFKIPELAEYAKNIVLFPSAEVFQKYFHEHTSVYLPKICTGEEDGKRGLLEILNQEHAYRLTPEGRSTDNILLTIGIPTAHRGNLVLKRLENLVKMPYDAEVEIAISKNCVDLYEREYAQIPLLQDARINYFDHKKALKITENWSYTVKMAHGKYVLLVSDEDDIVLEALEHYLALLNRHREKVSVVRAKTSYQYARINKKIYGKKGLDAFEKMFLGQNYLSGLIIRREDFLQEYEYLLKLERFEKNDFYRFYPHEWWCAVLSKKGDYIQEPIVLILEQESVRIKQLKQLKEGGYITGDFQNVETKLPPYATYDARLKQFQGYVEFIHFFWGENSEGIEVAMQMVMGKTLYLLTLAKNYGYDEEHFGEKVNEFMQMCREAIEDFALSKEQKITILKILENSCLRIQGTPN